MDDRAPGGEVRVLEPAEVAVQGGDMDYRVDATEPLHRQCGQRRALCLVRDVGRQVGRVPAPRADLRRHLGQVPRCARPEHRVPAVPDDGLRDPAPEPRADTRHDDGLPRERHGCSPAAMVTVFRPTPRPGARMAYVKQVEGVGVRLTLLWFLQEDLRACWEGRFTGLDAAVAESGLGRVELVAPFVPTVPGTGRYADQLR